MISIVTTLYCSEPYIIEFYDRISSAVRKITDDFEIIFVNDGSPDHSLEKVSTLLSKDDKITIVDLSRNFGHHKAMMTGLKYARGNFILMIDVDLEEEPELILSYWNTMQQHPDADVVYGIQTQRSGSFFKKKSSSFFYYLLNYMSDEKMPRNISFSRLMTRRYITTLLEFQEREMYIGGLWHIAGYKQVSVPIQKSFKGVSSYSFKKKMLMMINAITSFSNKPLILIFNIGLLISFFSTAYGLILMFEKILFGSVLSGWTSLMVSIWFLSGIIIMCLGIIAVYLSKIFIEVKQRPYTIVKQIYTNQKEILC